MLTRETEQDLATKSSGRGMTFVLLATVVFALSLGATSYRVYSSHYPGPNIDGNRDFGFCDFYNGIYYPTKAFLNGDNPYKEEITESYPISRHVPFFSPLVFVLHAPLTFLPRSIAAVAYFFLLVGLVLAISRLVFSILKIPVNYSLLMLIAGCLMFTRPGHNSIFNGYFTLELALGTLLALHYGKSRPALSTIGLVLASFKPSYALPLFILMLFRGHWRPAISGAVIASIAALAGLFWISESQSLTEIYGFVTEAQTAHHNFPNVWPVNTWTRVDLLAVIAKWNAWRPSDDIHLIVMLAILAIPCMTIALAAGKQATESDEDGAGGAVGLICMLAMLVSVYHHFYDGVVLCVPIVALFVARHGFWGKLTTIQRYVLLALLATPFMNYVSSKAVINRLGLEGAAFTAVTSVNGITLSIALFYTCYLTWKATRRGSE